MVVVLRPWQAKNKAKSQSDAQASATVEPKTEDTGHEDVKPDASGMDVDASSLVPPVEGTKTAGGGDSDGDGIEGEERQPNAHNDEQMAFMHRQPLAASGMAAALGLLKSSGELSQEHAQEVKIGRAKDARRPEYAEGLEDRIKIEYRDSDGRLLTKKEAFRQMSYKFHGHGPGQKKQEKRMKTIRDMERQAVDSSITVTSSALKKVRGAV